MAVLLQCCWCCCSVAGVAVALLHQGLADEGDGVGTEQPTMAALHTIQLLEALDTPTQSGHVLGLSGDGVKSFTQLG